VRRQQTRAGGNGALCQWRLRGRGNEVIGGFPLQRACEESGVCQRKYRGFESAVTPEFLRICTERVIGMMSSKMGERGRMGASQAFGREAWGRG